MRTALRTVLICVVGLVNILSTTLPVWPRRYWLLTSVLPVRAVLSAQQLALFCGILMIVIAYPAAAFHRRAAWTLIVCALLAVVFNLAKGLDAEEALISLSLAVSMWTQRKRFHDIPLRYTVVDVFRLGGLLAAIGVLYLALAWRVERVLLFARSHILLVRVQSNHAAQWISMATHHLHLQHAFINEASLSLPLFLTLVFIVVSWTSLRRGVYASLEDPYERFERGSHNSLAYIANRDDTLTFVTRDGTGAIGYRLAGRVALQLGAIMGPQAEHARIYREFRKWCDEQRLMPSAVALSPSERTCVESCGMRTLHIGQEAVISLAEFTVERLSKKMRWASRSLAKRGFTTELVSACDVGHGDRMALAGLDAAWVRERGGRTYGCAMTLGRLPQHKDDKCLIGLMRDEHRNVVAYLTMLPGGHGYYSLDVTRRGMSAPNAAMEFLLMSTLATLRERKASTVSLNFSVFSGLPGPLGSDWLAHSLSFAIQTRSLEAFNNKFLPEWSPRYLALASWWHLPDVIYAVLSVEGVHRLLAAAAVRKLRAVSSDFVDAVHSLAPAAFAKWLQSSETAGL